MIKKKEEDRNEEYFEQQEAYSLEKIKLYILIVQKTSLIRYERLNTITCIEDITTIVVTNHKTNFTLKHTKIA